ncbi:hypothetical protein DFH07DRAFT_819180 [Mycena maculata]|uniref:Uncharacterized protein n=1 Tax=Mycena maculata TaxID=230809 RepID=A0AAD7NFJ9_9AGAR|nr:hypothetical protein DFH07DRAFT_819180 [Mycena maculata]
MPRPLTFAYYCSGHGYGHATRVSALTCHLLRLSEDVEPKVRVFIVSSAPKHVFADSLELGAVYRNAVIDPVIVQPLAYRVDRQQSVAVLKSFLDKKDAILETEQKWLGEIRADCVLSDAAFIGCLAATAVGIPSILITNFTFDSVYSYLSTTLVDTPVSNPADLHTIHHHFSALVPDIPVSPAELEPLVKHIHTGYRCANLLLRLPGEIPIPSFKIHPSLPSPEWVDPLTNRFTRRVFTCLDEPPTSCALYPPIDYGNPVPRQIIPIPLLVRSPSPSVYSTAGRARLLHSIGIPSHLHSRKILIVSFGGQVFRRPGGGTPSSRRSSRELTPTREQTGIQSFTPGGLPSPLSSAQGFTLPHLELPTPPGSPKEHTSFVTSPPRLATASHLWIPGAPPVSKPPSTPISPRASNGPTFQTTPATPDQDDHPGFGFGNLDEMESERLARLLPDDSWLAVVCGVSKEQWNAQSDDDLPDAFFVAPRDVYMPDLTAVGDVLLGKLGYGTVAECVDSHTPFVYVSRPLFIEEHGLRRLLDNEGVGVELSRELYEAGDWSRSIETAWQRGRAGKACKRIDAETGVGLKRRMEEGRELATMLVRWTEKWSHQIQKAR